jgi:hypothetical protein
VLDVVVVEVEVEVVMVEAAREVLAMGEVVVAPGGESRAPPISTDRSVVTLLGGDDEVGVEERRPAPKTNWDLFCLSKAFIKSISIIDTPCANINQYHTTTINTRSATKTNQQTEQTKIIKNNSKMG